jgi:hypothetical protein
VPLQALLLLLWCCPVDMALVLLQALLSQLVPPLTRTSRSLHVLLLLLASTRLFLRP